ncbi:MAG TPA: stress responsive protein [Desulfomicrobiaceae bacterium]|nr:Dabb family protein [Desulfomicrobiaceae bacterium]MBZ4647810.1 stress responsive protein [Desulfomicrobiaceae bacterium]HCF04906.1 stress responsive protein [Desulfomicrobiaceae bacterium]
MIGHIVMWTLKPEVDGKSAAENAAVMKSMLDALPTAIDVIQDFHVSTRMMATNMEVEVLLFSTFATEEDLDAYQRHPEHQKCVDFIRSVVASRKFVDYHF